MPKNTYGINKDRAAASFSSYETSIENIIKEGKKKCQKRKSSSRSNS